MRTSNNDARLGLDKTLFCCYNTIMNKPTSQNPTMDSKLRALLDQVKVQSFRDPSSVSDAAAMGKLMSVSFEWDGLQILEATYAALEDANFHTENEVIDGMIKKLTGGA
jgi:hypothetical protein